MSGRSDTRFRLTELLGLGSTTSARALELREAEQVIGRSSRADLVIPVPSISRRHAAVWVERGVAHVKDLGSQSGTFVNSARTDGVTTLRAGDLLGVGNEIVFLVNQEETAVLDLPTLSGSTSGIVGNPLEQLALSASPPEKTRRYLDALIAIAAKVVSLSSESQLLAAVLDELEDVIGAERFFALLGDDPGALSVAARKLCNPDHTKKWSMPSKEMLRRALTSDKPLISFDAQNDERFRRRTSVAMSDVHSTICVALRDAEGALGVLYADNAVGAGLFSMDDGVFLEAVARFLTTALLRLRGDAQLKNLLAQAATDRLPVVRRQTTAPGMGNLGGQHLGMDDLGGTAPEPGPPALGNIQPEEAFSGAGTSAVFGPDELTDE